MFFHPIYFCRLRAVLQINFIPHRKIKLAENPTISETVKKAILLGFSTANVGEKSMLARPSDVVWIDSTQGKACFAPPKPRALGAFTYELVHSRWGAKVQPIETSGFPPVCCLPGVLMGYPAHNNHLLTKQTQHWRLQRRVCERQCERQCKSLGGQRCEKEANSSLSILYKNGLGCYTFPRQAL